MEYSFLTSFATVCPDSSGKTIGQNEIDCQESDDRRHLGTDVRTVHRKNGNSHQE